MALLIQKDAVREREESGPLSDGSLMGSGDILGAVEVGPAQEVIHPDASDEPVCGAGCGSAMQVWYLPSLLTLETLCEVGTIMAPF